MGLMFLDYSEKLAGDTLKELLTRLQAEVWCSADGLRIKGIVTVDSPFKGVQPSPPPAWEGEPR